MKINKLFNFQKKNILITGSNGQIGKALVKKTFNISRVGTIAGCEVIEGSIKQSAKIKLLRNGEVIHTAQIEQLKREKEEIKEAKKGTECGISIEKFNNILEGDIIEAFEIKSLSS